MADYNSDPRAVNRGPGTVPPARPARGGGMLFAALAVIVVLALVAWSMMGRTPTAVVPNQPAETQTAPATTAPDATAPAATGTSVPDQTDPAPAPDVTPAPDANPAPDVTPSPDVTPAPAAPAQ